MLSSNEATKERLRVFIETFGCQMNILDSELVKSQLENAGHSFVDAAEKANVVLLNTCSVRDLSEQKVLSRLGKLKERKNNGQKVVVGVLGCMAERAHQELLKTRPFIDVMVGPSKIHETKELVESAFFNESKKTKSSLSYFLTRKGKALNESMSPFDNLELLDKKRPITNRSNTSQAYVRITRGCNKFCAFCVVPRTRGPEVHRPIKTIIDEVKALVDNGAKEVTLLGQTINHYYYEENLKRYSFADLLFNIHEKVPHLKRLRFLTSYPRDFSNEALDVMRDCSRICKYLHIPAQSGSDRILKLMNRGYDVETYMSLINRAKERMPTISLVGDMIVGFPTETDEDFEMSQDLLKDVKFKNVFVFKYSPRPNTIAHKRLIDDVSTEVKKQRNNEMLALQKEIALHHHQQMVDKNISVLIEGISKNQSGFVTLRKKGDENTQLVGRTEGDHIVHLNGPKELIGHLVDVKIDTARPLSLSGTLLH